MSRFHTFNQHAGVGRMLDQLAEPIVYRKGTDQPITVLAIVVIEPDDEVVRPNTRGRTRTIRVKVAASDLDPDRRGVFVWAGEEWHINEQAIQRGQSWIEVLASRFITDAKSMDPYRTTGAGA